MLLLYPFFSTGQLPLLLYLALKSCSKGSLQRGSRMKICSARNVDKLPISRKNTPGSILGHFRPMFPWTEKIKNVDVALILLGGPMAAIHPVWGHMLAC